MIYFSSESRLDLDQENYQKIVQNILTYLKLSHCDLSILFVDEEMIQKLNKDYRNKDAVTDVLSFPQQEPFSQFTGMLGDVIICLPRAQEQAPDERNTLFQEVVFLTIHSILHLMGHDHMEDDELEEMQTKELEIVKAINFADL